MLPFVSAPWGDVTVTHPASYGPAGVFSVRYKLIKKKKLSMGACLSWLPCDTLWIKKSESALRSYKNNQLFIGCKFVATL